ncbi:MAG: PAS domain S-box protein [Candidatus Nanopelagicales bacterium]
MRETQSISTHEAAPYEAPRVASQAPSPSPEQQRLVLDYTNEAILHYSPDGTLLWASPSLERTLGYAPEAVVGKPFEFSPGGDADAVGEAFARMASDHQDAARFQMPARHADGSPRWVEVHAALVWGADGRPDSAVASVRDITALVDAEQALRAEQSQRLAVLESMLDPHVMLAAIRDDDGQVVDFVYADANDAACAYNRLPREKLVGSTIMGLLPAHATTGLLDRYANVVDTGEPLVLDDFVYPHEILAERRHFDIRGVKVGDAISFTWRDVTDRVAQASRVAASDQWQRLLLRSMAEGVVVHDRVGRIVSSNEAAQRMLGLAEDQMAGQSPVSDTWRTVHPDGSPFAAEEHPAVMTLATGRSVHDVVMGLRSPEGRSLWLLVNSVPLPLQPDGTGGGAISTFSDITTQIEAEHALDASREEYRLLAENAADLVFRSSPRGILEWVSPSVGHALGWRPEDLIGNSLSEILWHPDDLALVQNQSKALNNGTPVFFEARYGTLEGTFRWMAVTARPVFDDAGAVVSHVGSGRDVTGEVEARRALAASEERYRLLAENSSDVIVHVRDGVWAWVSPSVETELGGRREDWVGRRVADIMHPGDESLAHDAVEQVGAGHTVVGRARIRVADGTFHWVEARASAYLDANGQPDGEVAALRLVDDAVAAEAELLRRARYDDLTGLLKRGTALERLEVLSSIPPDPGQESAVMFVDIDNFKDINDRHGHAAGDAVLGAIADRIRATVRPGDLIARMGGDEFLVILARVRDLAAAVAIADRIRGSAHGPIPLPKGHAGTATDSALEEGVTLSVGVTTSQPAEDPDQLIARADRAMYEAKRTGRDKVVAVPAPPA